MKDPILLLSGGVDSTVLLASEIHEGRKPFCLSFVYGQKHSREIQSAKKIAAHYGVPHNVFSLPSEVFIGSALTGCGDIPHAHFENPLQRATVVPNRNAVLLSIAASVAVIRGADRVLFAAHKGDEAIYPDCRKDFVSALDMAFRLACSVSVQAPFLEISKKEIIAMGRSLDVPFALTWSCYEGGDAPCGECGACVERKGAES